MLNKIAISRPITVALITAIFISSLAAAQPARITRADFEILKGNWKGQLRYLDYSSNKLVTIPANVLVEMEGANQFSLSVYYTEEPDHNAVDQYEIKEAGTQLNDEKVLQRLVRDDGTVIITTETRGTDGNDLKASTFRFTYTISRNAFTLLKEVKHDGDEKYFERNQYSFTR